MNHSLSSHFRTLCIPSEPQGHCISMSITSRHFKSSGSLVSHMSHYMNFTWMVCRLSHCRPSWSPVSPESYYINDLQILIIPVILGPHWALGATIHQRHVDLAMLWVLGPQWAAGAIVWTTGKLMYLRAFWVPSESKEPLYEPHESLKIKSNIFKSNIFIAIQILYMYDKLVHWTQQYPWK